MLLLQYIFASAIVSNTTLKLIAVFDGSKCSNIAILIAVINLMLGDGLADCDGIAKKKHTMTIIHTFCLSLSNLSHEASKRGQ